MAVGYEGWAKLNASGTDHLVLCTGASVPLALSRIDSSSGYGGQIALPANEIGVGAPRTWDWSAHEGSMSFEATAEMVGSEMVYWLFNRQSPAAIALQSRHDNVQTFSTCFWTNMNLSANAGAAVEGTINFSSLYLDNYTAGGDYIGNREGDGYLDTPAPVGLDVPAALVSNVAVPFWKSKVTIDGTVRDFISWGLDFSQDVVRFFACENNVSAQAPKFVAVGPMTARFTGEYMWVGTTTWLASGVALENVLNTLYVDVDTAQVKTKKLELVTHTDPVQPPGSPTSVSVEYAIYELEP